MDIGGAGRKPGREGWDGLKFSGPEPSRPTGLAKPQNKASIPRRSFASKRGRFFTVLDLERNCWIFALANLRAAAVLVKTAEKDTALVRTHANGRSYKISY
jgi:hypothetical protein